MHLCFSKRQHSVSVALSRHGDCRLAVRNLEGISLVKFIAPRAINKRETN